VQKIVLRLELDGALLGEWPVTDGPLTLTLLDGSSEQAITTLSLALPGVPVMSEAAEETLPLGLAPALEEESEAAQESLADQAPPLAGAETESESEEEPSLAPDEERQAAAPTVSDIDDALGAEVTVVETPAPEPAAPDDEIDLSQADTVRREDGIDSLVEPDPQPEALSQEEDPLQPEPGARETLTVEITAGEPTEEEQGLALTEQEEGEGEDLAPAAVQADAGELDDQPTDRLPEEEDEEPALEEPADASWAEEGWPEEGAVVSELDRSVTRTMSQAFPLDDTLKLPDDEEKPSEAVTKAIFEESGELDSEVGPEPEPEPEPGPRQQEQPQEQPEFIPATDFADEADEAVTVVADMTRPKPRAAAEVQPEFGALGEYDELPVEVRGSSSPGDDLSLSLPYEPSFSGSRPGAYDEIPIRLQRRGPDDDLSLSLPYGPKLDEEQVGAAQEGEPSISLSLPAPDDGYLRAEDDDLTLPMPEEEPDEPSPAPAEAREEEGLSAQVLARPQQVKPRIAVAGGNVRSRVKSTAEVWFRKGGEWTPSGTLEPGQPLEAYGGTVTCRADGGLTVVAGPSLNGSATLPSGDLAQISPGRTPVELPAGTSVIIWHGELGLYVRSSAQAETTGSGDDSPVEYSRPPRPQLWEAARPDFDDKSEA